LGYVTRYYNKELLNELNKGTDYSALIKEINFEPKLTGENIIVKVKLIFDI